MGLALTIDCSYHQGGGYAKREEMSIDSVDEESKRQVIHYLESRGWVVQINGDIMDTYCSKKCAE